MIYSLILTHIGTVITRRNYIPKNTSASHLILRLHDIFPVSPILTLDLPTINFDYLNILYVYIFEKRIKGKSKWINLIIYISCKFIYKSHGKSQKIHISEILL